jgi:hypothetical protein
VHALRLDLESVLREFARPRHRLLCRHGARATSRSRSRGWKRDVFSPHSDVGIHPRGSLFAAQLLDRLHLHVHVTVVSKEGGGGFGSGGVSGDALGLECTGNSRTNFKTVPTGDATPLGLINLNVKVQRVRRAFALPRRYRMPLAAVRTIPSSPGRVVVVRR